MNGLLKVAKKSDVIVVGAGPLGWACAQLLSKSKIRTLLVDSMSNGHLSDWTGRGLGVFWPSLNDPPTRAVVAHGVDMAQWLQHFCEQGIDVAEKLLGKNNIQRLPSFRLAFEEHEVVELNAACQSGLGLTLAQNLGEGIYSENVAAALLKNCVSSKRTAHRNFDRSLFHQAKVTKIEDSPDACRIHLSDGTVCESEMLILANGYHIGALEPWLAHMLIPMSDVFTLWKTALPATENAVPIPFRASSGHVAGLFQPEQDNQGQWLWQLRLTGPRFLLPQAGAGIDLTGSGAVDASLQTRIESWIRNKLVGQIAPLLMPRSTREQLSFFTKVPLELQHVRWGVDCLPCDELPMLGELGHQGRILGATGWLGCGWSAGFQAAALLTEIVQTGKARNLKALLRPTRWRSGLNESVGGVTGMT